MSVIGKIFRGVFKRQHNNDDDFMLENPISHFALRLDCNSTDDDASSVGTYSTNSTVDDNPGPGRLVDKYLYQKGGRKVERLIFWVRIKLPNVHPVLISRILDDTWGAKLSRRCPTTSLSAAIRRIERVGKPGQISGLQSLVRQTQ